MLYFLLQWQSTGLAIDRRLSRKVMIYGLPIMGSGLLAFVLNGLDRLLIAESVSIEQLAIYSVALKFSIAVTLLMQPFGLWWMPKRFHYSMKPMALSVFYIIPK